MARETDFNFSDEVEEEEEGADTSHHAGDEEEEEEGAEDRGDAVTPGTGQEGDPDAGKGNAGAETGEEEEEEEEEGLDTEALRSIAGGGKPRVVPYERLAQVTAERNQLMEVLGNVAKGFGIGGEAAAGGAAKDEPTFDVKAAIKARNAALLEGDEDKAAEIDLAILEHHTNAAVARGKQEAMADFEQASTKRELDKIVSTAFAKYTFLNDQSEDYSEEALDEVMMYRNHYASKGVPLAEALQKAIDKVCPQYADEGEEEPAAGNGGKKPAATATGTRQPEKVVRNAKAARQQPPETGKAGVSNRETIDVSKLDVENMDDDKWDALPESVKAKLRGDATA